MSSSSSPSSSSSSSSQEHHHHTRHTGKHRNHEHHSRHDHKHNEIAPENNRENSSSRSRHEKDEEQGSKTTTDIMIADEQSAKSADGNETENPSQSSVSVEGTEKLPWSMRLKKFFYGVFREALLAKLLAALLAKLGRFNSRHPFLVIGIGSTIAIGLAFGLFAAEVESRPVALWVPAHIRSNEERKFYDKTFSPFFRIEQIITTAPAEGDNALETDTLLEMLELENLVYNISVMHQGRSYTLNDICYRPTSFAPCVAQTVLDYWYDKPTQKHSAQKIEDDTDLFYTVAHAAKTPLGNPIMRDNVVSPILNDINPTLKPCFLTTYLVRNTDELRGAAETWEREWLKVLEAKQPLLNRSSIWYAAEVSIQDELKKEISADSYVIASSYIIMFIYVGITLGKLNPVHSKFIIGFAGVFIIVIAIVSAFGFSSLISIPFSPISAQVVPFLVLATGIDDMFIIVNGYHELEENERAAEEGENESEEEKAERARKERKRLKSMSSKELWAVVEEKMGRTLAHIGPSLTLSQGSNFIGMMVGSVTGMPAMNMFCWQAGFAVIMVLFLELTVFCSFVALDAFRELSYRVDLLCCIKLDPEKYESKSVACDCKCKKWLQMGIVRKFISDYLTPFILHKYFRWGVIGVFLALFGVSIWGTTTAEMGLGVNDVMPRGSYVVPFNDHREDYFGHLGPPVYLVFGEHAYETNEIQDEITSLEDSLAASEYTQDKILSWLDDYIVWCVSMHGKNMTIDPINPTKRRIPPADFLPWLHDFLSDNVTTMSPLGPSHKEDITFDPVTGNITASRVFGYYIGLTSSQMYVDAMNEVRDRTDPSPLHPDKVGKPLFPYSVYYVFFEQYNILWFELLQNFLITLVIIFVVCLLLLGSWIGTTIVIVLLILEQVDILGLATLWGINMNPVVVCNMCMVTGICVEFTPHIVWAAGTRELKGKSAKEKTRYALREMGPNVTQGAFSTLLGIIVLSFAKYELFRTLFFRLYLLSLGIAFLHAVVLLPVVMSIFLRSPKTWCKSGSEKNDAVMVELETKPSSQ
ncbi:Niemann-Pick C type protein [Pelomyxa schiedti]|nr:Niemann-Pick C type protein [Pelomyxa schiedti]